MALAAVSRVINSQTLAGKRVVRQTANTFPYGKYADVMTKVSVGGIKPGELCTINFLFLRASYLP